MIRYEPKIRVGICEGYDRLRIRFNGLFTIEERSVSGLFTITAREGKVCVVDESGQEIVRKRSVLCRPAAGATFTLHEVAIGIMFHWERKQEEHFHGDLELTATASDMITAINEIGLEDYLVSVISSEMSAAAPREFLKAHAITSRSWLGAMVSRRDNNTTAITQDVPREGERIRWYDREQHLHFDVCADDHCQRYQGIPQSHGKRAEEAVQQTQGLFLVSNREICDARYHKACGGLTDNFATAWDDKTVPYLSSVSDGEVIYPPLQTEEEAIRWICSSPAVYCNTGDRETLKTILPSFDRETGDFFRWEVTYSRSELEAILQEKMETDIGALHDLVPLARGPSGRIFRLKIVGEKATVIVGKELEIRRLLSRSHLLSSAFFLSRERGPSGLPVRFVLRGAGWGHGVGLCQIGAAIMATKGLRAREILLHYFRGASLEKVY